MSAGKLAPIVGETTMNVSLKRAWSVLTEPDYVARWLGCMNYADEVGRVFYMQQDGAKRAAGDVSGATHCEVLALDAPDAFRFSWYLPGTPTTEVEIRLTEIGPKETRVTLRHSGWEKFNATDVRMIWEALNGGWISFVLPGLKRTAESAG